LPEVKSGVSVVLRIEPELCGPISIGTVSVIRLVAKHLELSLSVAMRYVDRCVFEGEQVHIPAPSDVAAEGFVVAIRALAATPRVEATVERAPDSRDVG
jgi:hypothetical protein